MRAAPTRRHVLLLAAMLAVAGPGAWAQADWPSRPVRIVVPFAPGGTTDLTARIVAEQLTQSLKQSFVVENKAGAGGNLGAAEVAKAAPDGYTFLMGTPGTQAINQFLYPKMPYDTAKDLVPVSFVVRVPNVLMVNPAVPAKDIKALIALLKAQPGRLSYGSPGNGATGHLSTELFKTQAGVFVTHIPYRGSGPMLQDLMAGQVQMSIDNLPSALPLIQSGKLVALGVTSAQPVPQLPGVPAIASVLPGYEAEAWFVLVAPAGTPQPIIDKLSAEVDRILKKPEVAERFAKLGATPVGGTPRQLGDFIAAETRKWQKVVKDSGAKVD
jgi:tripartite-type tricarboxylate transporter receptor subunit TctC